MSRTARGSFSTNVTCAAPRLRASMPMAPVPAYPSRNHAPSIRGASTLKSVSRSLSDVGPSPSHAGVCSVRPLCAPAMTRIKPSPTCRLRARRELKVGPARSTLPNANQTEPLLPTRADERGKCLGLRRIFERQDRFATCLLHQLMIAQQVADAKRRHARLPRAEEVAGAAKLEGPLVDLKAIGRLGQRLQPIAPLIAQWRLIQEDAIGMMRAAADASAQLMQLRQSEPFRVFHHHHQRIRT